MANKQSSQGCDFHMQNVTALDDERIGFLDQLRAWVRGHLPAEDQPAFEDLGMKLRILSTILTKGWVRVGGDAVLQALGAVFGDAYVALRTSGGECETRGMISAG